MDFSQPYNQDIFLGFLKDNFLPNDFVISKEKINLTDLSFKPERIQKIELLGEVLSLDLKIYEIHHESENDPRVTLSRETFRIMANYSTKKALILFYSKNSPNYRFSLTTIDLKLEDTRVTKEYSNPRRYSFFLGPAAKTRTPEQYLENKGRIKDFDDLKNRFSIEIVNKEFYNKIAEVFTNLAGGSRKIGSKSINAGSGALKLPSTNDDILRKEFTVRLIGRLVFCWFLKKKHSDSNIPLLPEEVLSVNAINENKNYYHTILEPLFFEVLNTPINEREKKYEAIPWNQIPFLNGGLFNPHIHDFYEPGILGISKHIGNLEIPDKLLKNLFEIFETYNFTIDENTSVDVELSIDPEMLGRVFENLLAEINPETGETARKSTGSYYTPRPIVEYMVDESLKQYLLTKTGLDEKKISELLIYHDENINLNNKEKEKIVDVLDKIKIIDPACGSGAFPMGMLQKMLLILQKIDPDSQKWFDKKLESIGDKTLQKELKTKFKSDNFNYIHKIGIIRDAIYGVDIQPIAVEISKLRFFLSLIVDEKVNDIKENRGIEPLPNLEFKFVCANSLIGLPNKVKVPLGKTENKQPQLFKKEEQLDWFEADKDIEILKKLRDEYLRSFGENKKKVEKKFQEVQTRMFKHGLSWGGGNSQTLKLSQWNPFSEEKCDWFDPDWMFGIKNGFDIVIANPPYIKEYTNREAFDGLRESHYYQGKMDIWYLFACKGIDLLRENTGYLTFIAQNNWVTSYGATIMREKVLKETQIISLIDFCDYKIFETAGIQTMIMIFRADKKNDNYKFDYRRLTVKDSSFENVLDLINKKENIKTEYLNPVITRNKYLNNSLTFSCSNNEVILDKILEQSNFKLTEKEVAQGIVSPQDYVIENHLKRLPHLTLNAGIFILNNKDKNDIPFTEKELELIKPAYTTKELGKYYGISNNSEWVIYTDSEFKDPKNIKPYPNIKKHLDKFQKVITSDNKPYGLHRARDERFFKDEKIISARKCIEPTFTYTDFDCYVSATFYVIKTERLNLKYLTAILNSKLVAFWLKNKGKMQGQNYQIDKEPLLALPLKNISDTDQKPFIDIVDKILTIKQRNPEADTSSLEHQIDQMVYKLYNLTEAEIKIIEK
ncbi:MAG TPA: type II restriction endonuclease [Elusimicrobia bacterium]|nr:type II restriction endonuclease [Elusimicrobiota bacterium]